MKHPAPEELASWLYGETSPRAQRALNKHLGECAECRAQVESWKATGKLLDDLPAPAARKRIAAVPWQWAAAAALLLGLGIVVGRVAFPAGASLRAETQQQMAAMRAELTRDFERQQREALAQVAAAIEQARAEDRAVYLGALRELGAKHDAEVATLKKGIETVVALADYGFEATEQRLAQLAANTTNE